MPQHAICPHCGQPMLTRNGVRVRLSRVHEAMFDALARRPAGVTPEGLRGLLYAGVPTDDANNRLKAQIWHLNAALAGTGFYVAHERAGAYRLVNANADAERQRIMRKAAAETRARYGTGGRIKERQPAPITLPKVSIGDA